MQIWRDVMPDLGDRLLCQAVQGPLLEITAAHESAMVRAKAEEEAFIARIRELELEVAATKVAASVQIAGFQSVFDAARDASDERIRQLENQIDTMLSSSFWRITRPPASDDRLAAAIAIWTVRFWQLGCLIVSVVDTEIEARGGSG